MQLPITGPFTAKDQRKSSAATAFIGRGSARSSTNAYAKAWGERANKGAYDSDDIVFLSVEGARSGRLPLDTVELGKACAAGATILTDTRYHRNRPYNIGEREAEAFLKSVGYHEFRDGAWQPLS